MSAHFLHLQLIALLMLATHTISSSAQGQLLELKGLRLGMTETDATNLYPWLKCKQANRQYREYHDRDCSGPQSEQRQTFTFGDSTAIAILSFRDNQLVRAEFITDLVGTLRALKSLKEKYGEQRPYLFMQVNLAGLNCNVEKYSWSQSTESTDKLHVDLNFPECNTGATVLHRTLPKRPTKPDV